MLAHCNQYLPNLASASFTEKQNRVDETDEKSPARPKESANRPDKDSQSPSSQSPSSSSPSSDSPISSGSSRKSERSSKSTNNEPPNRIAGRMGSEMTQTIDPKQNCLYLLGISGGKQQQQQQQHHHHHHHQHVRNSSLVRQKVTAAKESLASATIVAGLSLPLMIGGRSRSIVNVVADQPIKQPHPTVTSTPTVPSVPRNTAVRADQRRQNVVRPQVMKVSVGKSNDIYHPTGGGGCGTGGQLCQKSPIRLEDSQVWAKTCDTGNEVSVLNDWMDLHDKVNGSKHHLNSQYLTPLGQGLDFISNPLFAVQEACGDFTPNGAPRRSEIEMKQHQQQEMYRLKREQLELDKGIKHQHRFVILKIEERKRYLQIIGAFWCQRDFKHAIEKMVDIYNQGLVFADCNVHQVDDKKLATGTTLTSLNTSLVVDVISVIVLRPKLWNLDTCQSLLPIIVNDLLSQSEPKKYEYYIEMSIKALKLILIHFSEVIISTLENRTAGTRLTGVDISREDRVSKCSQCLELLKDAHAIITCRKSDRNISPKLRHMFQDVEKNFSAIISSGDQ